LATQILYMIGAVLLLTAEIFARAQLCCDERKVVYWALASLVLASGITACTGVSTCNQYLFNIINADVTPRLRPQCRCSPSQERDTKLFLWIFLAFVVKYWSMF